MTARWMRWVGVLALLTTAGFAQEPAPETAAPTAVAATEVAAATAVAAGFTPDQVAAIAALGTFEKDDEGTTVFKLAVDQEADWMWTCIAAFLVFFMQAGFALVEAGFTRAKNA